MHAVATHLFYCLNVFKLNVSSIHINTLRCIQPIASVCIFDLTCVTHKNNKKNDVKVRCKFIVDTFVIYFIKKIAIQHLLAITKCLFYTVIVSWFAINQLYMNDQSLYIYSGRLHLIDIPHFRKQKIRSSIFFLLFP